MKEEITDRKCARCLKVYMGGKSSHVCLNCRAIPKRKAPYLGEPLTPREKDILRLLLLGLDNKTVAHESLITTETTKVYVSYILTKLGARSRGELMARRIAELEAQIPINKGLVA